MLAKCTNSSCSASFRHLEEGVLFRLETDPTLRSSNPMTPEYYWLCDGCSAAMTLHISKEAKVIPIARSQRQFMVAPMGVISSCHCGRKGYCLAALVSRQIDIADVRDSSEDGEETLPHEWERLDDEVAAGSSCPMPACGTLAVCLRVAGVGRNRCRAAALSSSCHGRSATKLRSAAQ